MVSKASFSYFILLVTVMLLAAFGTGMLLFTTHYTYIFVFIILMLSGIILLIRFYNQSNKEVVFFFDAMRNDDTSINFSKTVKNKTLKMLYESMNRLNEHVQQIKLQNEYKEKYYKALIQHAATGLVVINKKNEVEFINEKACEYAGISAASTMMNLLQVKNLEFYEVLCDIKTGESFTYKIAKEDKVQILLLKAKEIRNEDYTLKLIAIQDIKQELDEKELESFQRLISILTHEIMNSIAPLTSMSRTLYDFFIKDDAPVNSADLNEMVIRTTVHGLKLIEESGLGLTAFVNNYRRLTKIPQPVFRPFSVDEWMQQLSILYTEEMKRNNIQFNFITDNQAKEVFADKNLLHQVVVNLIKNASEAVIEKGDERKITINIHRNKENRTIIKVTNNGPAIPSEDLEKIFIPFFTTKASGSGIGLSISRQIMRLHKGSINVISNKEETSFVLEI